MPSTPYRLRCAVGYTVVPFIFILCSITSHWNVNSSSRCCPTHCSPTDCSADNLLGHSMDSAASSYSAVCNPDWADCSFADYSSFVLADCSVGLFADSCSCPMESSEECYFAWPMGWTTSRYCMFLAYRWDSTLLLWKYAQSQSNFKSSLWLSLFYLVFSIRYSALNKHSMSVASSCKIMNDFQAGTHYDSQRHQWPDEISIRLHRMSLRFPSVLIPTGSSSNVT